MAELQHNFSPGFVQERKQLLFLAVGSGLAATGFWWFRPGSIFAMALGLVCVTALLGRIAYSVIGRDVYVIFAAIAFAVGFVVSWVAVVMMYVIAIVLCGAVLRLFGMDKLRRCFADCKALVTMFVEPPKTSKDSFGRQS
jgi:hypothetical protein